MQLQDDRSVRGLTGARSREQGHILCTSGCHANVQGGCRPAISTMTLAWRLCAGRLEEYANGPAFGQCIAGVDMNDGGRFRGQEPIEMKFGPNCVRSRGRRLAAPGCRTVASARAFDSAAGNGGSIRTVVPVVLGRNVDVITLWQFFKVYCDLCPGGRRVRWISAAGA